MVWVFTAYHPFFIYTYLFKKKLYALRVLMISRILFLYEVWYTKWTMDKTPHLSHMVFIFINTHTCPIKMRIFLCFLEFILLIFNLILQLTRQYNCYYMPFSCLQLQCWSNTSAAAAAIDDGGALLLLLFCVQYVYMMCSTNITIFAITICSLFSPLLVLLLFLFSLVSDVVLSFSFLTFIKWIANCCPQLS